MRIVFIGTPEFAVASLEALLAAKKNIVGVITAPDKPAGRGKKIQQSAVKEHAVEQGLPLLQPTNLKDPEFLRELEDLKADLNIVVAFRMLPEAVWNMPKHGTFNLHGSLLPQYRGAAPINWAIINGEKTTGVTTFFLKHKIDTGSIILQRETAINHKENVGELYARLMHMGADLVVETVNKIESNDVTLTSQEELSTKLDALKPAPKLNKENCAIDWENDVEDIYNHIRGLSPYPCAYTFVGLEGKKLKLKIYAGNIGQEFDSENPLFIQEKKRLGIANSSGTIWITELQLEGKKRMDTASFLAGLKSDLTLF